MENGSWNGMIGELVEKVCKIKGRVILECDN